MDLHDSTTSLIGKRTQLLILDDEELVAKTLHSMALRCGIESSYVCTSQAFFQALNSIAPDLVAIDLKMPDMDGIEVLKELARIDCKASILITSGTGTPLLTSARRIAERLGLNIFGVLGKPFSMDKLSSLFEQFASEEITSAAKKIHRENGQSLKGIDLLDELKLALKNNKIDVYFQPKVLCATGTLEGFEALARWQHSEVGAISPEVFIALSEVHGLIDLLTQNIVRKALNWIANIKHDSAIKNSKFHDLSDIKLSLNISAQSLGNELLFNDIVQQCVHLGISPNRIILEITESSAMDDSGSILENLTRLRLMGFELSIDDFGTGYSSMVQLVKVPFSEVKIDRSFVIGLSDNTQSASISRSISDLAHSLEMQVTAEGIEDADTFNYLREIKCDIGQGFFIGKPMPGSEAISWYIERESQREAERLSALHDLSILDTPPESRYDRLTRLARRLFDVPISLVTLVDKDRQWFKSDDGLGVSETSRDIAFCNTAIQQDDAFVVNDAQNDSRFKDNPLVTGNPNISFYAGQPLYLDDGHKLGTLCIIDTQPRNMTKGEMELLFELGELVKEQLSFKGEDLLDEKLGILPKGTYNKQARKALKVCRKLNLDVVAITVRLMNLGSIAREFGEERSEQLLRELGKIVQPFCEVTDLIGHRTYSEVVALVIAPDAKDKDDISKRMYEAVVLWNQSKRPESIKLDCEIGISIASYADTRPLDQIIDDNWQLYAAIIDD